MVTEFLISQLLAECFILYSLQKETVNREQTFIVGLEVQLSGVTMTYETKSSGNIIKTLEINDLSQITCYYSSKLIPLSSHRKPEREDAQCWAISFLFRTPNTLI